MKWEALTMVSTLTAKTPLIRASKINQKSSVIHPLARFVTEETVALLFNVKSDEIYRIDCWRHVVYVHAKGVSKFVSYADFPPIVAAEPPSPQDFCLWRKRWRNHWNSRNAPAFWTEFYQYQFKHAVTELSLLAWGQLIAAVKSLFSDFSLEQLRKAYKQDEVLLAKLLRMRSQVPSAL